MDAEVSRGGGVGNYWPDIGRLGFLRPSVGHETITVDIVGRGSGTSWFQERWPGGGLPFRRNIGLCGYIRRCVVRIQIPVEDIREVVTLGRGGLLVADTDPVAVGCRVLAEQTPQLGTPIEEGQAV